MPFVDPGALPVFTPRPGWTGRAFHSAHMTFVFYDLEPGADVHPHDHENEEVWNVVAGAIELTLGGETRVLRAGDAAVVPAGATHAVCAVEASRVIVVDHPVRGSVAGVPLGG